MRFGHQANMHAVGIKFSDQSRPVLYAFLGFTISIGVWVKIICRVKHYLIELPFWILRLALLVDDIESHGCKAII